MDRLTMSRVRCELTYVQRIAEGISEEDAWRLFQQIVDALVHMSSLGIVSGAIHAS